MEIDIYSKLQDPIAAIDRIGEFFAKSGMFGCDKIEQGKVLAMVCIAQKKSPDQVLREYYLIEGKLSDRADAMLAKFMQQGGKFKIASKTPDRAEIHLSRDGQTFVSTLTWEEVQKEPFVHDRSGGFKKNWRTPRARMQTLWARAVSDGVRTIAPDVVCGLYTPEELDDQVSSAAPLTLDKTEVSVEQPKPQPKAETKPVVDAEVVKVEEKPGTLEASNTETTPPATSGIELPASLVESLEKAIGEHGPAAVKYMRFKQWIKPDQNHRHLDETTARKIINFKTQFIEKVLESKARFE